MNIIFIAQNNKFSFREIFHVWRKKTKRPLILDKATS